MDEPGRFVWKTWVYERIVLLKNKQHLGVFAGAALMLLFTLGTVLAFGLTGGFFFSKNNLLVNLVIMFFSPIAGGFCAGLICQDNARRAGFMAGLSASVLLWFFWLVVNGLSWQTLLNGLVLIFVWVVSAWIGAGFSVTR